MIKRIVADIVLLLTLFFAPWYVAVGLGVLFMALFPGFWEAVLAGLFLDAMYAFPDAISGGFYGAFGVFTILFLFLFVLAWKIKKQIRI